MRLDYLFDCAAGIERWRHGDAPRARTRGTARLVLFCVRRVFRAGERKREAGISALYGSLSAVVVCYAVRVYKGSLFGC